jgi:two-component system, NarL family, nitrate/nitrite response regulator NarL
VRLRCLLVDDNAVFLETASRILESQGLRVVGRARTTSEALELAAELRPEVALVDVELGDENGFDLAESFAAAAPATRVILISTHAEEEFSALLPESPAVGFLAKNEISAEAVQSLAG